MKVLRRFIFNTLYKFYKIVFFAVFILGVNKSYTITPEKEVMIKKKKGFPRIITITQEGNEYSVIISYENCTISDSYACSNLVADATLGSDGFSFQVGIDPEKKEIIFKIINSQNKKTKQ